MTDIQPLTDEELAGPYGRAPKVWCCSDCRYRWEERLLATIDAKDAEITNLREALTDCLHRLGNMWLRFDIPWDEWDRLKQEAAAGIGNTGNGDEYAWKLNWIAFERGRAALEETR